MRIDELLGRSEPTFSFEFFPPKTPEGEANFRHALTELTPLEPTFVSVTYGAGGTTRDKTVEIVRHIKESTPRRELELVPGLGVAPVLLGMARAHVHRAMGQPDATEPLLFGGVTDHCLDSVFQVSYTEDARVDFIELSRSSRFDIGFRGVQLDALAVHEAVRLLTQHGRVVERAPSAHYIAPELSMALWRAFPVKPSCSALQHDPYGFGFAAFSVAAAGYLTGLKVRFDPS